jgi:hypothetical protein
MPMIPEPTPTRRLPGQLAASNENVARHESCHVEQAATDAVQSVVHGLHKR